LFSEPLFWGPILIISIQQLAHMTLPDIYFMEATVMVLCVILNIPAGALADIIGRKKTLIIAMVFHIASRVFFITMTSPLDAWIGNILWAFGYSLQNGADVALLYSNLNARGLQKKFSRIEGCAVGGRMLLIAFCSLAVGPMASINMRLPLYCCLPFLFIPLIVSFYMKEPVVTKKFSIGEQLRTMKDGTLYAIRKPEIRWIIGFCALLVGASKIWFFTYNPYFVIVGIDLRYYGVIFFLLNIVAWASSHWAHRIQSRLNERSCIVGMIVCVGLPILIMGVFPLAAMAYLVTSQNMVRGFMRPFTEGFMNHHINSEKIRATVLSVRSSLSDMVTVISLFCFGMMDKRLGLLNSLIILGITVLILGMTSYRRYCKLFPQSRIQSLIREAL
jgi:MFS family permease